MAMHRLAVIGIVFVGIAVLGAAQAPSTDAPKAPISTPELPWTPDLRLVYESDTRAYYRPCGCNQNSAGGLSRRAALLADLRAQSAPLVVCSAGDFYGTPDVFNEAKSRFVARMMGELGYDAIGLGEMDLNFGLAVLVADVRAYDLPVVCANLIAKHDSLRVVPKSGPAVANALGSAFPPYRIVKKGGARIAFVGLLSPATKVRPAAKADEPVEAVTYTLKDPFETAATIVPQVRGACDMLVVLAHMDETSARRLAESVPGIDYIVMGHDAANRPLGQPEKIGTTMLLRATSQGQNIGDLAIKLDGARPAETFNRIHVMDASYRDDPAMSARIDDFDEENRKIQKELFARQQLKGDSSEPFTGRYLGVGACQSCHVEEFEIYSKTRHAHAYATLASQFVHRDTNCVGCHVTGFGEPGGFEGVRLRGTMVDLIDVQCEACHGPGQDHARDGSYRATAIASCTKCHTPNDDPDFDFATDWPKIAH
jgi:2',3'-cyclic-nucleotide 2'-phosphodiesterase (5'-nucleotidase family)